MSLRPVEEGQRVVVTSRAIGRTNIVVGTVVRVGTELRVGPLLLRDELRGPNPSVRIIASQARGDAPFCDEPSPMGERSATEPGSTSSCLLTDAIVLREEGQ